jgi:hypothetical protein
VISEKQFFRIVFISLSFIFFILLGNSVTELVQARESAETQIMITAAHLDPDNFTGYTLVYTDEALDKAFYLNNNYKPQAVPVGTRISINDTIRGKVVETEEQVFYVECADPSRIAYGLSGQPVMSKSGPIGFVSALEAGPRLLCVYY